MLKSQYDKRLPEKLEACIVINGRRREMPSAVYDQLILQLPLGFVGSTLRKGDKYFDSVRRGVEHRMNTLGGYLSNFEEYYDREYRPNSWRRKRFSPEEAERHLQKEFDDHKISLDLLQKTESIVVIDTRSLWVE